MSERDLGEWRARSGRGERGERKYMYIYNFLTLYKHKRIFYNLCFLYKVREASERARSGRGERKYMYIYNFLSLYTNTNTFYCVCIKSERGEGENESGERDSPGER